MEVCQKLLCLWVDKRSNSTEKSEFVEIPTYVWTRPQIRGFQDESGRIQTLILNLILASMQGFISLSLSQTGLKLNEWSLLKKESQERSHAIGKCQGFFRKCPFWNYVELKTVNRQTRQYGESLFWINASPEASFYILTDIRNFCNSRKKHGVSRVGNKISENTSHKTVRRNETCGLLASSSRPPRLPPSSLL